MNSVPIFEAKNRLPFFIHQAESSGPVFISRRNKNAAVLISFDEYNSLIHRAKKPSFLERVAKLKKEMGATITDEQIDEIFGSVRDTSIHGTSWEDDIYKGVFDD